MGPDSERPAVPEIDRRHAVVVASVGGFFLALGKVSLLQRVLLAITWQSGGTPPHSKTWPLFQAQYSLASWSAAVLRRFGIEWRGVLRRCLPSNSSIGIA